MRSGIQSIIAIFLMLSMIFVITPRDIEPNGIDTGLNACKDVCYQTRLPQLNWTTRPDTSASNPTTHKYLEATIGDAIPGAKCYRVDRVTDAIGGTLHSDVNYPKWSYNTLFMFQFQSAWMQTSAVSGPVYVRVSAWDKKDTEGGVQVSQNSSVVAVHYDHTYETLGWDLEYKIMGPGLVNLKVVPNNTTLAAQTEIYTWFEYVPKMIGGVPEMDPKGHPKFVYIGEQATTVKPEYLVSLSEPGVRYFGLYGAYNGGYGNTPRPNLDTGTGSGPAPYRNGSFQPIAVVVPYENGTIPQRVVNYTGINVTTPKIPGDHRLALLKDNITIFSGGTLYQLLRGSKPQYCEVEVPQGVKIWNTTDPNTGYRVEDISSKVLDGSLRSGFSRLRLNKTYFHPTSYYWYYMDICIPMTYEFLNTSVAGKDHVFRFRVYDGIANSSRKDNWQNVTVHCVMVPDDIQLPNRLSTGITWSGMDMFRNSSLDNRTASLTMYKKLGFNTVPDGSKHWTTVPSGIDWTTTKENRTGPLWDGMMFGPEHSTFGRGYNDQYGLFVMIGSSGHLYINTTALTSFGVPAVNVQDEKQRWLDALDFHDNLTTGVLDVAYRGVWFNRSVQHLSEYVKIIEPEYIFLDSEDWAWFSNWEKVVSLSANAENGRLLGETDHDLAYRMSDEFWTYLMDNITAASPGTKVALYDATSDYDSGYQSFTWEMLQKHGVIAQPSIYSIMKNTGLLANYLRLNHEHMLEGSEMIPWFSSGCYGEHDASLLIDTTAHSFLNGATGLSFYAPSHFDDMADLLNIAYVIGYISPYEDIIMDGDLAYENFTASTNAITSAMGLNGSYVLAVTPKNASAPVTFTFQVTNVTEHYSLYDLRHEKYYNYTPGASISFSDTLPDCGLFILRPYLPVFLNLTPVLQSVFPANNSVNVTLRPILSIRLFDNETDMLQINWTSNYTGPWQSFASNASGNQTNFTQPSQFSGYNATYWWGVNVTDGHTWLNRTFMFTTIPNLLPIMQNESPTDGTINVSVKLTYLNITIFDPEGNLLNWSIETSPFIGWNLSLSDGNGTKTCPISNLTYNTTYTWYVNVTDPSGSKVWVSRAFNFTTELQPKNATEPNDTNITPPPKPNLKPFAVINGPYFGYAGEILNFTAIGSRDPNGTIALFLWDFGDENNATGMNASHTYASAGNYSIALTVRDELGLEAKNLTYALIVKRNHGPVAPTLYGPAKAYVNETCNFTITASDPDGDRIVYFIDWEDGKEFVSPTSDSGSNLSLDHAWSQIGNYTIRSHVIDIYNLSSSEVEFKIEIASRPTTVIPAEEPEPDGIASWIWMVILVGVILLILAIVILVFLIVRKRRQKEAGQNQATGQDGKGIVEQAEAGETTLESALPPGPEDTTSDDSPDQPAAPRPEGDPYLPLGPMQPQKEDDSGEILTDLDDLQFDETGRLDNELGLEEDDSFLDKDWEDGPVAKSKEAPKDQDVEEF